MQPIIIESDDFGMTIPISRAIITGLKTGVISTTNAQVTSPHFEMSAALAQQHGITAMGLHLVLDKDRPISQPLTIPSLVNPAGFCHAYQTLQTHPEQLAIADVKREFQAQIDRFLASGLQLTHLTSHHFVATLTPEIYAIVLELAQTYHVPVRNETAHLRPTEQAAYRLLIFNDWDVDNGATNTVFNATGNQMATDAEKFGRYAGDLKPYWVFISRVTA
ncbi:ChbG/HpnK family deacetylase [Latilactobacillus curvatus]|uniref:ChbG/HpnK family deacetylase n=1 Tax=Latilactobacillus curvatus TaxID=28038 RepID=UPI0039AF41AD